MVVDEAFECLRKQNTPWNYFQIIFKQVALTL